MFRADRANFLFGPGFIERLYGPMEKPGSRPNVSKYLTDSFSNFLQRRNEFWTGYGQIIIATLIIIVLTILLLTKTISAEAGLPILSGISGFAIAKGVSSNNTSSSGPDERQ